MGKTCIIEKDITVLKAVDYKKIIDALLERFNIEYKKKDRSGIYGFTQRELTYNSNKMEGSRLSKEQTTSLFNTGTVDANGDVYRAKDIEECLINDCIPFIVRDVNKDKYSHALNKAQKTGDIIQLVSYFEEE